MCEVFLAMAVLGLRPARRYAAQTRHVGAFWGHPSLCRHPEGSQQCLRGTDSDVRLLPSRMLLSSVLRGELSHVTEGDQYTLSLVITGFFRSHFLDSTVMETIGKVFRPFPSPFRRRGHPKLARAT
ncbi:hypothetical protein PsYK624_065520 [Phanerochaete sordida]|uniref:Uncharacterized protein n=1 Tax=Phanerochaete sordida TaxID=48140 RepID=A0A9P3G9R8_9APHY|nr:hypothetical protein PsYK624_065520 [Phanerochaete sordida]